MTSKPAKRRGKSNLAAAKPKPRYALCSCCASVMTWPDRVVLDDATGDFDIETDVPACSKCHGYKQTVVESQGVDLGELARLAVKEMRAEVEAAEARGERKLPTRQNGVDHITVRCMTYDEVRQTLDYGETLPNELKGKLRYHNETELPAGLPTIYAWGNFDKMAEAIWRREYAAQLQKLRVENQQQSWKRAGEAELHVTQLGKLGE